MNEPRLLIGPASKAFIEGMSDWEDPPQLGAQDRVKVKMRCFHGPLDPALPQPESPNLEPCAIQFVPDSAGFSTQKRRGDHLMDALQYSITMDLTPPVRLTRWQRFRLWSPRRWLARALRNISEWLEPQGWE